MTGAEIAELILDLSPSAIKVLNSLVKVWGQELTQEQVREILRENRDARRVEQDILRARIAAQKAGT